MMEGFSLIRSIKEWSWAIAMLSTGLFGVAMLFLRDKFITKEEHSRQIAAFTAQIDDVREISKNIDNRVVKLESLTEHLPDREAFQEMADRISNVEKAVAVTTETVRGTNTIVAKIDRTLDLFLQSQLQKETKGS